MVRNVSDIYSVMFRSLPVNNMPKDKKTSPSSQELSNITPDFNIKIPQKYAKLGEKTLPNGLVIHSYVLANGHKVSIVPMQGSPATVKNYVNVGSMNETDDIKGISHFLEHMAFNGTTGENGYTKLVWGDSFKKIEELGGWTNASTNYAITDYVNSTPLLNDKDINEQIKIIASMTENLALTDEMIEKEKNPVCSEINMIMDRPETIAIDQTVRSLFNIRSSADELVAGSTEHIQNLNRDKVKAYYNKYYTPDNMNLVITGDVNPDEIIETVAKEFRSQKVSNGHKYEEKLVPLRSTVRKDFISDKADSAIITLGFEGPASNDAKALAITDILDAYLASESCGIRSQLDKLNTYGFGYNEKISSNPYNPTINIYTLSCSEDSADKALKILFNKFSGLQAPDEKTLNSIKKGLLMDYQDNFQYSQAVNNAIGKAVLSGNLEYLTEYEKIIKSITTEDINDAIGKYYNINKAALTVVHPEKPIKETSFKGRNRKPVNMENVELLNLDNNYRVAFQEDNNKNITYRMVLSYDLPKGINPVAADILGILYDKGYNGITEEEYNKFNEDNNLYQNILVSNNKLNLLGYSNYENFDTNIKLGTKLLHNPKINQKEFDTAVNRIKDILSREQDTSESILSDYEYHNNPYISSKEQTLKSLETVTIDDVKKLHEYIMNNSQGIILMNIPKGDENLKKDAISQFNRLDCVKPHEYKLNNVYVPEDKPVLLTKARSISQADITQTYKYKLEDTIKEFAAIEVMNKILSSSDSIGLFNSLRERDHLAYSVHSETSYVENTGYISLNILTTTDNKDTGEISYDNLQKSINGFHRQIQMLLDSKYTDEDLESAKKKLKAGLLNQEGTDNKLSSLCAGLQSKEGIDYKNKLYSVIDTISREDIDNYAKKIFAAKPVYSIVASQDTIDANRDFLADLTV